jgi:mannitol 2-dehydrogenase
MRRELAAQDWLSTVVEQEADASAAHVIGPMVDFVPPGDRAALLARMADPAIRIVSLTITEGGYYVDPATQAFDAAHPDIVRDARDPADPRTVFGLILAGLARRRQAGLAPFTVMSCDNIRGNGNVTRATLAGLAEMFDPGLARFVRGEVAFPNGMVDRITPATSERERTKLAEDFGIADQRPVFCEAFRQWVLEDHFPTGRPALEEVGVQFVADVDPFEQMKISILNGGHAAIAYPAGLLGIHFVHDAMADRQIAAFLRRLEEREIIPTLAPVPGTDLLAYFDTIERRFANPKIADTIPRLCLDGFSRQPKFILPTAAARLAAGGSVDGLALVSALWARYCYGETEAGATIPPNDNQWDRLTKQARLARSDPKAWLAMRDVFGELAADARYVAAFSAALTSLWAKGVRATLDAYLAG